MQSDPAPAANAKGVAFIGRLTRLLGEIEELNRQLTRIDEETREVLALPTAELEEYY